MEISHGFYLLTFANMITLTTLLSVESSASPQTISHFSENPFINSLIYCISIIVNGRSALEERMMVIITDDARFIISTTSSDATALLSAYFTRSFHSAHPINECFSPSLCIKFK